MTYLDDLRAACSRQLDWQAPQVAMYLSYYDGESAIIALLESEERQVFRRLLDESYANWAALVANAVAERLQVVAFEWGDSSDAAWALWQANSMDADAELVQTDSLVTGRGYVLVQPSEDSPAGVSITAESPLEATVLYAPGSSRRRRLAGFKRFVDPVSQKHTEVLILPEVIATWAPNATEPEVAPNPAGLVGLHEINAQPRTSGAPRSELDPALPIVDRIHTMIFNRLVASDFGAFRQVWATGMKLARQVVATTAADGVTTEQTVAVKPFNVGANQLLVNEDPSGKFGAFPGDPLTGYLAGVEQDVDSLAGITQTPPYYFGHSRLVNLAADAIKALEAGLVAKTQRRMLHIGEGWEAVMRTALGLVGDPGAANMEGQVIWRDPETRSMAQVADALTKLATIGVPKEVLWRKAGATPQEVAAWRDMETVTPPPAPAPPQLPAPAPETAPA